MKIRFSFLITFFITASVMLSAQNPVKWSFEAKDAGKGQADLIITATIDEGWYTYSQFLESEDGPLPTSFTFKEGPHYKLVGKAVESGGKITAHDNVFNMKVTKFKRNGIFTQRVQILDASKPVTGYVSFMVCDESQCLPPRDVDFSIALPTPAAPKEEVKKTEENKGTGSIDPPVPGAPTQDGAAPPSEGTGGSSPASGIAKPNDPDFKGFFNGKRPEIDAKNIVGNCQIASQDSSSLWAVFLGGFLGGFLALLTPCVFPMIPLTVSFFTKRSKTRAAGLRNAFWYGASIILIYVGLGSLVTALFGPTVLNEMSTNVWFNIAFFAIFILFALSFFGFFEITLPSSWANKSDQMADKGGALGIFFMAFTLALVSFSCTGPIVGTLLVESARASADGGDMIGSIPLRPLVGMFGFGLALALPFGLFAMFPGWLQSLPKSGGWMDNVKFTLGFVEIALALKFLSTADMVDHWGMLRFEAFMALWIVVALLLGLYQLGVLGWKGALGRPGALRATVGIASLLFAGYMIDGLFNYKSLSLLSGLAPPVHYNFFHKAANDKFKSCPHDLECYHDFDEGLAVAQKTGKPVFVDFTGYGCVNCRKMEENVWYKKGVIEHLRNNYVVISLYVDDKQRLFPDDKFHYLLDQFTGEKIRSVGDKWSSFQVNNFGASSQPYYVLMHNDGKTLLNQPRGYTPNLEEYKAFLDCGYNAFAELKSREENAKGLLGLGK